MVNLADRVKLLGKYKTPRFRYGQRVTCAIRGEVAIVGLTDARIPWPKCRSGQRSRAIIVYGDLEKAIRRESAHAVRYWFGVGNFTVWQWRKALGVERVTEGTSASFSRHAPRTCQGAKATRRRVASYKSAERGAKIGAALAGRTRPPEVVEAVRRAKKGRKLSAAARQRMREGQRNRKLTDANWTPDEDALLGTMTDREVAERLGCDATTVAARRYRLGVPAFVAQASHAKPVAWTRAMEKLLGKTPDTRIARKLGCSDCQVFARRQHLGIAKYRGPLGPRSKQKLALP